MDQNKLRILIDYGAPFRDIWLKNVTKGRLRLEHYTLVNDLLWPIEVLYAEEICYGTKWGKKAFPVSQEKHGVRTSGNKFRKPKISTGTWTFF